MSTADGIPSSATVGMVMWRGKVRSAYRNVDGTVWFFYTAEDLSCEYRPAGATVAATFKEWE